MLKKNDSTEAPVKNQHLFVFGDREYLSLRATAKALGVSYNSIFQRAKHGTIKTVFINGRKFIPDWSILKELTLKKRKKSIIFYTFTKTQDPFSQVKPFSVRTFRTAELADWLATLGNGTFEVKEIPALECFKDSEQEQEEFIIKDGIVIHATHYEQNKIRLTIGAKDISPLCKIGLCHFPIYTNETDFAGLKNEFFKDPIEAFKNFEKI